MIRCTQNGKLPDPADQTITIKNPPRSNEHEGFDKD